MSGSKDPINYGTAKGRNHTKADKDDRSHQLWGDKAKVSVSLPLLLLLGMRRSPRDRQAKPNAGPPPHGEALSGREMQRRGHWSMSYIFRAS